MSTQLRPNEKVLWQGKPVLKAFIFSTSILPMIFGLFFLIPFVLFFLPNLLMGFFYLDIFSLLFLIVPLALIFGPTVWSFMAYKNTEYLISDQRIITQTGAIGIDTRLVDLEKIQEVYVRIGFFDRIFGTGSIMAITAGQVYVGMPGAYGWGGGMYGARPSLSALREPYEVQKLLQEAIREAKKTNV